MFDRTERLASLQALLTEHAIDGNLNRAAVVPLVTAAESLHYLPDAVPAVARRLVDLVARAEATETVVVDVVCWVAGLADG